MVVSLASMRLTDADGTSDAIAAELVPFAAAAVAGVFVIVCALLALAGNHIVHAVRNPSLSENQRAAWVCALGCLSVVAIPLYWVRHMRPR